MTITDRAMIQDPAGLVQRIPELKPLCEDPGVLHAVERGDPFRLYRALLWVRWLGRLRSHREVIDALLSQRRLFARPIKGSLWLGTVNGFGATLLGDAEPDSQDGTHIATHCLVALFVIPLLPLGAYVVRPASNSHALRRGWTIFARVPLGPLPWLWSRTLALAVMALVVFGAGKAFLASRYQDVRVLNGFDQPLSVELAGVTRKVQPRDMIVLSSIPVGRQKGRAVSEEGVEVDTIELDVSTGLDVLAWNVAGAAPLYRENVSYGPETKNAPPPNKPTFYCGRKELSLRGVDYAFREPPSSLEVSDSNSRTTRSYVGVAHQDDSSDPVCLTVLAMEDRLEAAAQFLEMFARMSHWELKATNRAVQVAMRKTSPQDALRIAKAAVQARPEDVELQRMYQWVGERAGSQGPLLEEYRAQAQAQPDSATAQYLYARLLSGKQGSAAMEQLAQRFPQDLAVLRAVVYSRWRSSDWPGTMKAWESLRSLKAEDAATIIEAEATALVAMGRRGAALELLKKTFAQAGAQDRDDIAELYARIARLEKSVAPDELIAALEAEGQKLRDSNKEDSNQEDSNKEGVKFWALRARAGLPTEGAPNTRPGMLLMAAVSRDPRTALEQAARLPTADLPLLTDASWALAYGEAVRTGATATQQILEQAYLLDAASLELFRRFVRGEAVSLDESDLLPEMRAAACFVRSRNAALPTEERRHMVEQARREDWLRGTVSEAMASWSL